MSYTVTLGKNSVDDYDDVEIVKVSAGPNANTNYYATAMQCGMKNAGLTSEYTEHTLVLLDLSRWAGETLEDASIFFYSGGVPQDQSVMVYPMLVENWVPSLVTWNKYDGVNNWPGSVPPVDASLRETQIYQRTVVTAVGWTEFETNPIYDPDLAGWMQLVIDGTKGSGGIGGILMYGIDNKNYYPRSPINDDLTRPYVELTFAGSPPAEGGLGGPIWSSYLNSLRRRSRNVR